MNKLLLLIIVLAVVFSGAVWFLGSKESEKVISLQPRPTPFSTGNSADSPTLTPTQPVAAATPKNLIINMTDSGFNPAEVVINAGDTVRFVNQSSQSRWPASAVHPTHEFYPDSSISKCNLLEPIAIFNACRGLQKGEGFSFTFNEKGIWPYHDHLAPSAKGKVIVR